MRSYLKENWRLWSRKLRLMIVGIRRVDHVTPLYPQMFALNFAYNWRSLSRYISFAVLRATEFESYKGKQERRLGGLEDIYAIRNV
jgi:hypothetical protein